MTDLNRFWTLLAAVLGANISAPASAQELDKTTQAANNFAHEHMTCASFFAVSAECIRSRPDAAQEVSDAYDAFSLKMAQRGIALGDVAGVSEKASLARYEMGLKEMLSEMDNSCTNISILLNDHLRSCERLHNEPRARLNELIGR